MLYGSYIQCPIGQGAVVNTNDQISPLVSMRMQEGWSSHAGFDYKWIVLEHMIQPCIFPPFEDFDDHFATVKVTAARDTNVARKIAKRAIQQLKPGARDFTLSGQSRGGYHYVLVGFRCSTK